MEQPRDAFIDTWRFIAVMVVVVSHLAVGHPTISHADLLVNSGLVAVLIFFFISGFVVSKSALHEAAAIGTFSMRAFYTRRAFRIIPPLLAYVAACALLGACGLISLRWQEAVNALLYVCNIEGLACGWYTGHTWSLAFEEQFYLLFPALFLLAGGRRTVPAWMFLLALPALPAFIFPHLWVGRTGFVVIYGLFGLGYLFARYERIWRAWRQPDLLFIVGVLITAFPVSLFDSEALSKYYKLAYLISIPVMVAASGNARFGLAPAFRIGAIALTGQASYSIYLWQQLFTGAMFHGLSLPAHALLVGAMVLGCLASYKYFERPLIRMGRALSPRAKTYAGSAARSAG